MKTLIISIVFLLIILTLGCQTQQFYNSEFERIDQCQNKWTYKDLENNLQIKAIYYLPMSHFDIVTFPNFVIGITANNDTIGVVDKNYKGTINKNDLITIGSSKWSDEEKRSLKPKILISKRKNENSIYCKLNLVYYGKIIKE